VMTFIESNMNRPAWLRSPVWPRFCRHRSWARKPSGRHQGVVVDPSESVVPGTDQGGERGHRQVYAAVASGGVPSCWRICRWGRTR